jgi:hypothetical protein
MNHANHAASATGLLLIHLHEGVVNTDREI